jgi:hypothetical protein
VQRHARQLAIVLSRCRKTRCIAREVLPRDNALKIKQLLRILCYNNKINTRNLLIKPIEVERAARPRVLVSNSLKEVSHFYSHVALQIPLKRLSFVRKFTVALSDHNTGLQ